MWKGGFDVVALAVAVGLRARLWTLSAALRSHLVTPTRLDDYVKNNEVPLFQIRIRSRFSAAPNAPPPNARPPSPGLRSIPVRAKFSFRQTIDWV